VRHRAYRGRMVYLTEGQEMGREHFAVTIQPDGTRTLRAQCEMDDDRLLRDLVLTVDADWRPVDAFIRLTVEETTVGATWFRFGDGVAEAQGWTATRGRFEQEIETERWPAFLGTHALHCDAWVAGRLRAHRGPEPFRFCDFTCSTLANGGSGPELIEVPDGYATVRDLGRERVGGYDTHHVRIEVPGVDDFDVWAGGEDCLPVRLSSDGLGQIYELEALEGDWQ
jgi:hypothetical protein